MVDPEDRCLKRVSARSREQRDQQLGALALDPHRLLDSERPDPRGGGRHDPLACEPLRAGPGLAGERLGGERREPGKHGRGVRITTRGDRLHDREANLRRGLGLLERHEQRGRQVLHFGRVLELRRAIEHRQEVGDDLLVEDLGLGFGDL